uniref:Heparan-alpha-glucosaminide N-acetyltransferase catalytic domain-containing protein n=1 Tax=Biomphalaria glabrata TaxID=6526 RepID=A0A2C9JQJ3_BIOGL
MLQIVDLLLWQLLLLPAASCVSLPLVPFLCDNIETNQKINTAQISIKNGISIPDNLAVYLQTQECYKCDLILTTAVRNECVINVDSRWLMRVEIRVMSRNANISNVTESCSEKSLTRMYTEGGQYSIYIDKDNDNNINCTQAVINEPSDPNIPIYIALGGAVFLILLWNFGKFLYRLGYIHRIVYFWSTESMMSDLGTPTNISQMDDNAVSRPVVETKERLRSLDTFRGITILLMIFVNYGGGKYWFFKHSKWNGLTVADLVFPWFIFIMGTALAFSFQGQLKKNVPRWKISVRILKRSAKLFLLGLLINSFGADSGVDFTTFRIPGVLQRFAGTYLITATSFLLLAPQPNTNQYTCLSPIRDIVNYWPEWILYLAFIGLHCAITFALDVPGCPRGYLGPGGLEQSRQYFNCTGGASGYIDRLFFGEKHIYQSPTSQEVYKSTVPYDPEGLLGTLTSCVQCFLGLQAGKILINHNDWVKRCRRFFTWAIILAGLGLLLCKCSYNDGWIPINKNLWSLSFVFVLSGMAFFLLMVCYILVDVYKVWSGGPFFFAGMNSIALYCLHEFFSGRAPVYFMVHESHASLLPMNLWGTAFWLLVSVYFYYKNIFITV